MTDGNERPILIKKVKKVSGGGHHGGAWKVAYADFVTAMMAFFLLMWLLNATTEVQRKGIADYFNPVIPINRISGGGEGAFGGDNIFTENSLAQSGTGSARRNPAERVEDRGDTGYDKQEDDALSAEETAEMQTLEEMLTGKAGESMVSLDAARHIVTKVTDEGLIVELFDLPDAPLFIPGTTTPMPIMEELIDMVSRVFVVTKNQIAVNGFTSAMPIVVANNPVWDLSSGRADVVRQRLESGPLPEGRTQRVSGYADRKPVVAIQCRLETVELRLFYCVR